MSNNIKQIKKPLYVDYVHFNHKLKYIIKENKEKIRNKKGDEEVLKRELEAYKNFKKFIDKILNYDDIYVLDFR